MLGKQKHDLSTVLNRSSFLLPKLLMLIWADSNMCTWKIVGISAAAVFGTSFPPFTLFAIKTVCCRLRTTASRRSVPLPVQETQTWRLLIR